MGRNVMVVGCDPKSDSTTCFLEDWLRERFWILKSKNNNITEIHEKETVERLNHDYLRLPCRTRPFLQRAARRAGLPDKNVNCCYTAAAFTISPESRTSLCCTNFPGDLAVYAVSVRRLIALHSGLDAPCGRSRPRRAFLSTWRSDGSSRFHFCL